MIKLIAMLDLNFGIGDSDGDLLFNLPKDLAHFKSITTGKTIVMGRKTWDSLPKKPLPKRKNYILTRDKYFETKGNAKVVNSIEEVLEMSKSRDVYIIGGGELYEQFLPYADEMILTHVHKASMFAYTFFPDFDKEEWKPLSLVKNEADEKHKHSFTFANYIRKSPKKEIIDIKNNSTEE